MKTSSLLAGLLPLVLGSCGDDTSESSGSGGTTQVGSSAGGAGGSSGSATGGSSGSATGGSSGSGATGGVDSGGNSTGGSMSGEGGGGATSDPDQPAHDICADLGSDFSMGAAIFGETGTEWLESASEAPTNVDWTYGYLYASADPHEDLEGFDWLVNFRLDTAEQAGATIPTVTFYRMLNVGEEHGYTGSEPEIVQSMLTDASAVSDYLDDFVALLTVLSTRTTPPLLHVEPDSWGFMMWAFAGFDGVEGNPDATQIPVSLAGAAHPDLEGQGFADHAGGLGRAMLWLRDQHAPDVRLGWHASNFRVGTRPDVVSDFYSSMGAWDVIVTEPPQMNGVGSGSWDVADEDNQNNLNWLSELSTAAGLPIVIWQTYVTDAAGYLGAWPDNQDNLSALADSGVASVLWDPNGNGGDCAYACAEVSTLLSGLSAFSSAPLPLPADHVCSR